MISARSRKNTVRESKMEMHKVTWSVVIIIMIIIMIMRTTFSPESAGR